MKNTATHSPAVVKSSLFAMQVCVPSDFTDDEVLSYSNWACPCGTENGWMIRHEGDPLLDGAKERVPCEDRPECVHIMLDA